MSISVSEMNEASKHILTGVTEIFGGAMAGGSILNSSPAGALFGATSWGVRVLTTKALNAVLPLNHPKSSETAKCLAGLAVDVFGMIAGFFALKMIGITLTAAVVGKLFFYTTLYVGCTRAFITCFCPQDIKQSANPVPPEGAAPAAI